MQSRRLATKILGAVFGAAVLAVAQTAPQQPDALDLLNNVALSELWSAGACSRFRFVPECASLQATR